jgi:hypothetical protein
MNCSIQIRETYMISVPFHNITAWNMQYDITLQAEGEEVFSSVFFEDEPCQFIMDFQCFKDCLCISQGLSWWMMQLFHVCIYIQLYCWWDFLYSLDVWEITEVQWDSTSAITIQYTHWVLWYQWNWLNSLKCVQMTLVVKSIGKHLSDTFPIENGFKMSLL